MFAKTQARWRRCAACALLLLVSSQPLRAQPLRPDPTDPKAPVPALVYQSHLRAYQRFEEPAVAPWRQSNEQVRQRGGWRGYRRDAPQADAATAAPAAASAPVPGHPGHQMK